MIKPIFATYALTSGKSLVLYQNDLPQRKFFYHPVVKVAIDVRNESLGDRPRREGDLCYDDQGFTTSLRKRGLLVDSYF